MFLTASELHTLTGYVRPSKQREWLLRNNIEHTVALSGRPLVRIEALGGTAASTEAAQPLPLVIPEKPGLLPMETIRATRARYTIGAGTDGPGVYFLWDDDQLLYIGLSIEVPFRLRAHFMKRVDAPLRAIWFNSFSVIQVPEFWLKEIEVDYIRRERPPCNIRGNHDIP